MNSGYQEFLATKRVLAPSAGIAVDRYAFHPLLFEFQRDLIQWSLRKGRAALFTGTGTGKTVMSLEWAKHAAERSLIIAPLAVAKQTVREGQRWAIPVTYARVQEQAAPKGITITNYEMAERFDASYFGAVVLDESSRIKDYTSKTRNQLIAQFKDVPMRLCCTATPAPNDIAEITNHAEFLGVMSRTETLATFFVHDESGWRLKGHAEEPFYRWLSSWAMSLNKPSDLGYSDYGFALPPLKVSTHFVDVELQPAGKLFVTSLKGVGDRAAVRKATVDDRIAEAVRLVEAEPNESWLIWCGLIDEGDKLTKALKATQVKGSDSIEHKESALLGFAAGNIKRLVSKPSIAGHGMNFQTCARVLFVGLGDSWEDYYQAIRRCWRFGQTRGVNVHVVLSDIEGQIFDNVLGKEREAMRMHEQLITHMAAYEKEEIQSTEHQSEIYEPFTVSGPGWEMRCGDSVDVIKDVCSDSIDLSVFSPPFAQLYTYSNSERDLGNARSEEEFFQHFNYLIPELLRVTKPGRICAVHVFDIPAMLVRDGYIGLKDFSGDVVKAFIAAGWVWDARIPIDKNQQAQSIRTHSKGLTMTQMKKDRTWLRPALPDYILKFRKPGENLVPVRGGMTGDQWIELANPTWPNEHEDRCAQAGPFPTWYGIRESDTLHAAEAREEKDEKHICPLQLPTIERCIKLWSNPDEVVLDPFAGIGSTGYQALLLERQFIGFELKPSYAKAAVNNLKHAQERALSGTLFEGAEEATA